MANIRVIKTYIKTPFLLLLVIEAAILFCDLRHSTRLEQELGREQYIRVLNLFFDIIAEVISAHDGEVLKFIGDAALIVFPEHAVDEGVLALLEVRGTGDNGVTICSGNVESTRRASPQTTRPKSSRPSPHTGEIFLVEVGISCLAFLVRGRLVT